MRQLIPSDLREQYGSVYITELPDGQLIPWHLLPLQEYINYKKDFDRGLATVPTLENEIFCKCVTDKFVVQNIDKQKAGTISSVVKEIMEQSGPVNPEAFNAHLSSARHELTVNVFNEMAILICAAFPAYKLEDVYALTYDKFILRLAQAEYHLIRTGYIKEPLQLLQPGEEVKEQKARFESSELKTIFEKQELEQQILQKIPKSKQRLKDDITPKFEQKSKNGRVIISKEELRAPMASGADIEDLPWKEQQMMEDAAWIYKDYMEDVKAGKEVIIKTPQERLKEQKVKSKARSSKLKQSVGK
jgi:hypothetical protein